jgi:hypothetical protein
MAITPNLLFGYGHPSRSSGQPRCGGRGKKFTEARSRPPTQVRIGIAEKDSSTVPLRNTVAQVGAGTNVGDRLGDTVPTGGRRLDALRTRVGKIFN